MTYHGITPISKLLACSWQISTNIINSSTGEKQTDYKIFTVPQITYMFEVVLHQFKQNFSLVHYESKIKSQAHTL